MTRAHLFRPLQDGAGNLQRGATVRLYRPGTTELVASNLYVDETGDQTYSQPIACPTGFLNVYLDRPRRFRIGVTPFGGGTEVFFDDIDTALSIDPAANVPIDPIEGLLALDVQAALQELQATKYGVGAETPTPAASEVAFTPYGAYLDDTLDVQVALQDVDDALVALDGRQDTTEATTATQTGRLDGHETRLDEAEIELAGHETRLDTLESTDTDYDTRLDALESATAGAAGYIHNGTGVPLGSVGVVGDYFHSTDLKRLYGPKVNADTWGAPAIPVFRAFTERQGPGALAVPPGTVVGDALFLSGVRFLGDPGAAPTGWTPLHHETTGNFHYRLHWKPATQADIDNGVVVGGNADYTAWEMTSWGDVDQTTALRETGRSTGVGGTITSPAVPTSEVDSRAIHFAISGDGATLATADGTTGHNKFSALSVAGLTASTPVTDTTVAAVAIGDSSGNSWAVRTIVLNPAIVAPYVDWSEDTAVLPHVHTQVQAFASKTANYTLIATDGIVFFNGANLTATLPTPVGRAGQQFIVKNLNATNLTVGTVAGTIDGTATRVLAQYDTLTVVSDGTNWGVL